jgi:tetratricopeptide (TPR) repeat protein
MRALAVAACLVLLVPSTASAADGPSADQLFADGRDLLEKGRFAEACEKLRQSEELAPASGTLMNLGYCYEQVGKLRSAMNAYTEAQTLAAKAKDEKREKFAHERFVAIEPKALKLVVRVVDGASTGIEVKRNDVVVPPAQWGVPVAVDPEDFAITASAPGKRPWRGVVIGRGEGAIITVVVPTLEEQHGAEPSPGSDGKTGVLGTKRIVALGLGGVALGTLAAGAALGFSAKSRYDDSLAHCDDAGCSEAGVSEQNGAVAQGNVATVLVAVGLVCLAGGAYLWITGGDSGPAKRARVTRPGVFVW